MRPASRQRTLRPRVARTYAAMPPEAPDPTTITSYWGSELILTIKLSPWPDLKTDHDRRVNTATVRSGCTRCARRSVTIRDQQLILTSIGVAPAFIRQT